MPLVGAAVIPNTPLLLPKLAPWVQKRTNKTREAIYLLSHELYARQPTLVVLLATAPFGVEVCSLLQAPKLPYSFAEWGDVVTQGEVKIATGFTHRLKERAEATMPLLLKSTDQLPVNVAVPAFLLSQSLTQCSFVFVELKSNITIDELIQLSGFLQENINESKERTLLLAAGNLAEQAGPAKDEARIYDQHLKSLLQPLNQAALANIDIKLRKQLRETIWAPVTLLSLVVAEMSTVTNILSYEAPVKVGYVVANINLN